MITNLEIAVSTALDAKRWQKRISVNEVAEAVSKRTGVAIATVLPGVEAELRKRFDPLLRTGVGLRDRCLIVEAGVEFLVRLDAMTGEQTDAVIAALKAAAERALINADKLAALKAAKEGRDGSG